MMEDFGKEKNDYANLPQEVKHEKISEGADFLNANLNDGMSGIDANKRANKSYLESHKSKVMY